MFKKRIFLVSVVLFLFSITTDSLVVNARAYEWFGYKNYNGITYKKFWIARNASSVERQYINDAMYSWNTSNNQNVVTPMNVSYTNNKNLSIIDFSKIDNWWNGAKDVAGETTWWNWDRKVNNDNGVPYQNWSSALIQFGGPGWDGSNSVVRRQVIAHEIGHAVGLAHNFDMGYMSIMRTPVSSDKIPESLLGPFSNDLYGIRDIYS